MGDNDFLAVTQDYLRSVFGLSGFDGFEISDKFQCIFNHFKHFVVLNSTIREYNW